MPENCEAIYKCLSERERLLRSGLLVIVRRQEERIKELEDERAFYVSEIQSINTKLDEVLKTLCLIRKTLKEVFASLQKSDKPR